MDKKKSSEDKWDHILENIEDVGLDASDERKKELEDRTRINANQFFSLLSMMAYKIDGVKVDVDTIRKLANRCMIRARRDPDDYREVRHNLLSRNLPNEVKDHPLKDAYLEYGPRSIITNTLARLVSIVKLSQEEVDRRMRNVKPPAFKPDYMYSDKISDECNAYRLLDNWEQISGLRNIIYALRDKYKKYKESAKHDCEYLTNGSSIGITLGTINLTDVMGNIYQFEEIQDPILGGRCDFNHISRVTGLINDRGESDKFVYLGIDGAFNGYSFKLVNIPDKDGKIRSIYQGNPEIQTISKSIHKMLDDVAREIPGNYTYNQRDWIEMIVKEEWNKSKYIIGTDMSKFSDTLKRDFMLEILRKAGFDEDFLREMDILYSLPVLIPYIVNIDS